MSDYVTHVDIGFLVNMSIMRFIPNALIIIINNYCKINRNE